jgi:hypothetical protein
VYIENVKKEIGGNPMTTTGELHAIVEELELVDIGDAASYLGEEVAGTEEIDCEQLALSSLSPYENSTD